MNDKLTIDQAAAELAVSPSKVYALCAGGELAHHRIGRNGGIRIRRADLDAFLASCYHRAKGSRGCYGGASGAEKPAKDEKISIR